MMIEMPTGAQPFARLSFGELISAKQEMSGRLEVLLPTDEFSYIYIEPLTLAAD